MGTSPLYNAATRQDPSLLNQLIQAGANVDSIRGGLPPFYRIQGNVNQQMSLSNEVPALYHAVYFQNDRNVEILLANGANPRIVTPVGVAYDWAVRHQDFYDQDDNRDLELYEDPRTREQRRAAAARIVDLNA